MALDTSGRYVYTNIKMSGMPHIITLDRDMIFHKDVVGEKKKRDGRSEVIYDLKLNLDFWEHHAKKPCRIVIDEAHNIVDARRHSSKQNILMNNFISLLRRITEDPKGGSDLTLISQLHNRIDSISRDLCTHVRYFICHYNKVCRDCGAAWNENSEMSELYWMCPCCGKGDLSKQNHMVECWHFSDMNNYLMWKQMGMPSYYAHYCVNDIEKYFPLYDTLQWSNLINEY